MEQNDFTFLFLCEGCHAGFESAPSVKQTIAVGKQPQCWRVLWANSQRLSALRLRCLHLNANRKYRLLTLHLGCPWKHLHHLLQHNVLYLLAFFSFNLFPKVIKINKVELWTLLQDSSRFYVLQDQAVISPLLRIYGCGIPAEINYITYRSIPQKFTVHEKLNMHGLHLYRLIKL